MSAINKLGTQIRFTDGREGTVVYNGLDGVGVKWGLHDPDMADFDKANPLFGSAPKDFKWFADAMLREPYPGSDLPCIPDEYEITRVGL